MDLTACWQKFSKKAEKKILHPMNSGFFLEYEAQERGMRFILAQAGSLAEANAVRLYWLVDESDGVIVDTKFQVFGEAALIAIADAACGLLIGKNYEQSKRLTAEFLDKELSDKPDAAAFPEEMRANFEFVLLAIANGASQCKDIALPQTYVSPVPRDLSEKEESQYPDFLSWSKEKKIALLEELFAQEIRPYIELDEGGIEIVDINDREILVSYQGACTSCFSAIGATLSTIQHIVQTKVHPELTVIPNMDGLNL